MAELVDGLRNTSRQWPLDSSETPGAQGVRCEALVCPERFCLCQLSISRSASLLAGDAATSAGRAAVDGISGALGEAKLRLSDVMVMRVYFCPDILTEEAARKILHAAFSGCFGAQGPIAPVFVPVLAVGSTPATHAAIHIVMMAVRTPAL